MAYLLTLFGSGAVFTPEINALATNSGQIYWFAFTCVIFCLYVIMIHYAFKFWCGKELFAQNKRDDYRSFERINLFYWRLMESVWSFISTFYRWFLSSVCLLYW